MIIDFRAADCPSEFHSDLCIIGSGAAGLAMAQSLANTKVSVCIVESGGLKPDLETQALYDGDLVGLPWRSMNMSGSRCRRFGGSTWEWGGGCVPLDASDMEARDWVPHSGWPLGRQDLDSFYEEGRRILSLPDHPLDADLGSHLSCSPLAFDPASLAHVYSLGSGRRRLAEVYRPKLEQAKNLTVLLNANLLEIEVNEDSTLAKHISLKSLDGRLGRVKARYFVLACGGIENARLLLLSNSTNKNGVGNDNGLVGRFFMDHPKGRLGSVLVHPTERLTAAYDRRLVDPRLRIFPQIALSWSLQQSARVLNGRLLPDVIEEDAPDGIVALRKLRCDIASGTVRHLPRQILRIIADLGRFAPCVYRRAVRGLPAVDTCRIEVNGFFEQAPNPDSRVSLSDETDALGQRKAQLDWRLTELDRRTYETAVKAFSKEVTRLGLGRVVVDSWLEGRDAMFAGVDGAAHHMGTTRMSDDPGTGVVDRQCRVHGMDNLYVAGSSVFPTGGWAFPTFTIVALALRLTELLRRRLRDDVVSTSVEREVVA